MTVNALLQPLTWILPVAVSFVAVVVAEVRPVWLTLWYKFILWVETKGAGEVMKPLGACAKCTAGMFTLVLSIIHHPTAIAAHLTSASVAILVASGLTVYYQWTQRQ